MQKIALSFLTLLGVSHIVHGAGRQERIEPGADNIMLCWESKNAEATASIIEFIKGCRSKSSVSSCNTKASEERWDATNSHWLEIKGTLEQGKDLSAHEVLYVEHAKDNIEGIAGLALARFNPGVGYYKVFSVLRQTKENPHDGEAYVPDKLPVALFAHLSQKTNSQPVDITDCPCITGGTSYPIRVEDGSNKNVMLYASKKQFQNSQQRVEQQVTQPSWYRKTAPFIAFGGACLMAATRRSPGPLFYAGGVTALAGFALSFAR